MTRELGCCTAGSPWRRHDLGTVSRNRSSCRRVVIRIRLLQDMLSYLYEVSWVLRGSSCWLVIGWRRHYNVPFAFRAGSFNFRPGGVVSQVRRGSLGQEGNVPVFLGAGDLDAGSDPSGLRLGEIIPLPASLRLV